MKASTFEIGLVEDSQAHNPIYLKRKFDINIMYKSNFKISKKIVVRASSIYMDWIEDSGEQLQILS